METTVIYLDIDGVMLPGRAFKLVGNEKLLDVRLPEMERMEMAFFDPEAIHCLRYLVRSTNAKIVIISSWLRAWHERREDF